MPAYSRLPSASADYAMQFRSRQGRPEHHSRARYSALLLLAGNNAAILHGHTERANRPEAEIAVGPYEKRVSEAVLQLTLFSL